MLGKLYFFILAFFFSAMTFAETRISAIPLAVQAQMKKYTWHPGCPILLKNLSYLTVNYWGFDQKVHTGVLVVNKTLAPEIAEIFDKLYRQKFPIQRIEPMYIFKGNDEAAMQANNTSAFNCREVTGKPGIFSEHSYGWAIDINTLINPYVKNNIILPPEGASFVDRTKPYPGKITQGSFIYNLFIHHGWVWGGDWHSLKDYQHFEKPLRVSINP